ncbi:MAG: molybdate ABC transporter substrate-binding protein [Verrucomicrobiota bacterium]|nr:molybdate ABC transporter substrate-binding protein [Verrucomicrobiota bacterium]
MHKLWLTIFATIVLSVSANAAELLVSAAASLNESMKAIAARFENETGNKVSLNFGGSNLLARQIMEGASVDVFVSADEAQMNRLVEAGKVAAPVALLTNSLVIVAPSGSPVHAPSDLEKIARISLADPQAVPAGVYPRQFLETAGLWEKLKAKVVPAENVRAALAVVEAGNADAGIVYRTDARIAPKLQIVSTIPPEQSPKIIYPAAVLNSSQKPEAKAFLLYLKGAAASEIFQRAGFGLAQ